MKRPIKSIIVGFGEKALNLSDYVTYFEYTRSIKKADNLEITIEGGDAEWVMEHEFMRPGMPITFQYGFAETGMCAPITLHIGDIDVSYKPGFEAVLYSADPTVSMNKVYSNITWKNKTAPQIVKTIAEMHQINCIVQVEHIWNADNVLRFQQNRINFLNDLIGKYSIDSTDNLYLVPTAVTQEEDIILDNLTGAINAYKSTRDAVTRNNNVINTGANPIFQSAPIPIEFKIYQSIPQAGMSNRSFLGKMGLLTPGFIAYFNKGTLMFVKRQTNGESVGTIARGDEGLLKIEFEYTDLKSLPQEIKVDETKIVGKDFLYQSTVALGDYQFTQIAGNLYQINPDNTYSPLRDSTIKTAIDNLPKNATALSLGLPLPDNKITVNDIKNLLINGTTVYRAADQLEDETVAVAVSMLTDSSMQVLTAKVEEEGNINRDINTVVTLSNVATRFTGNYLIYEVVDRIDDSGFFTKLTAYKDAGVEGEKQVENANNTKSETREGGFEIHRYPLHISGGDPIQTTSTTQTTNVNGLEEVKAPTQGVEINTNGFK